MCHRPSAEVDLLVGEHRLARLPRAVAIEILERHSRERRGARRGRRSRRSRTAPPAATSAMVIEREARADVSSIGSLRSGWRGRRRLGTAVVGAAAAAPARSWNRTDGGAAWRARAPVWIATDRPRRGSTDGPTRPYPLQDPMRLRRDRRARPLRSWACPLQSDKFARATFRPPAIAPRVSRSGRRRGRPTCRPTRATSSSFATSACTTRPATSASTARRSASARASSSSSSARPARASRRS